MVQNTCVRFGQNSSINLFQSYRANRTHARMHGHTHGWTTQKYNSSANWWVEKKNKKINTQLKFSNSYIFATFIVQKINSSHRRSIMCNKPSNIKIKHENQSGMKCFTVIVPANTIEWAGGKVDYTTSRSCKHTNQTFTNACNISAQQNTDSEIKGKKNRSGKVLERSKCDFKI